MITKEQAERYSVHTINKTTRVAVSNGGDIGILASFFDENGYECEPGDATSAVVTWPGVDMWTAIDLRDYEPEVMH